MWEAKVATLLQGERVSMVDTPSQDTVSGGSPGRGSLPTAARDTEASGSVQAALVLEVGSASQLSHPEANFEYMEDDADGQIAEALLAAGIQPGPDAVSEVMRRCESSGSVSARPLSADWHTDSRLWAAERLRRKGEALRSKATP